MIKASSLLLAGLLTVQANAETIVDRLNSRTVITGAHRSGTGIRPSNTLWRFKHAVKAGIDIIETDLRLTKDGVPVIFHDAILDKDTQNCEGPLRDKTYQELQKCNLNLTKEKIPSFEDALKLVGGKAIINAEFKVNEVIIPAIELVKKYSAYEWVFFQTKADRSIYQFAREYDNYIALLFKTTTLEAIEWAISLNDPRLIVLEMEKDMITQKHVEMAHAAGKFVLTNSWRYTFHQEILGAACKKVWKHGADIAISNRAKSCVRQAKRLNLSQK